MPSTLMHAHEILRASVQILSAVPDDQKRDLFFVRVVELLNEMSSEVFCDKVQSLVRDYPNCATWISWYLQDK